MSVTMQRLSVEEARRRFEAEGFSLTVRPLGADRYVACATERASGRGPVAMGDTTEASASAAWLRFEKNRQHFSPTRA